MTFLPISDMSTRTTFSARLLGITFAAGAFFGIAGTALTADVLGSTVFRDVPAGSYYDVAAGRMQAAGIMKGMPDGSFAPGQFVTRAELVTVIDRMINGGSVPVASSSSSRSRSSSSTSSSSSSTAPRSDAGEFHFTTSGFSISNKASSLTVSVIRSGGSKGAVGVTYTFSGGTAVAEKDYNPATGVLSFKEGETTKIISLKVLNSGQAGPAVTANLVLSKPTGGAVLSSPSTAVVTILNGNTGSTSGASSSYASASSAPGGTMSFSALGYSVEEKAGSITITVRRSGASSSAVNVEYSTANGTGTSGTNYSATQGTLNFAANEVTKTFSVQVTDNPNINGNKTFSMTLKNATGNSNLGYPSTATVTIVDDEVSTLTASGSLQFSTDAYVVGESDGAATILVNRTTGASGTVTVNYYTADSNAIAGSDYTAASGTLTFGPGETTKYFLVPITKDSTVEDEERVNLVLSGPTGGAEIGSQGTATLKIRN